MFKGILPARRVPSTDFTIITTLADPDGKENQPTLTVQTNLPATNKSRSASKGFMRSQRKKNTDSKRSKESPVAPAPVSGEAFDKLLDDLQIPSSLRPKLYGMDASVKAAMLKSSQTMAVGPSAEATATTAPRSHAVRKAHSTDSMNSPRHPTIASLSGDTSELPYPGLLAAHVSAHHSPYLSSPPRKPSHSRGISFEGTRLFSKSQVNLVPSSSSTLDLATGLKSSKEKGTVHTKNLAPTRFCSVLATVSSTQLDVEDLKKLRLLLRNESASWSEEFLKLGGYTGLLTRLNEILEVEWREEQHDDQVLHELLRCFKALSTSSIGCFALRSSCPTPFVQLVALLYSDKKPGEVATRQLIVELLLLLFDLYPPSSLPSTANKPLLSPGVSSTSSALRPREAWESQTSVATSNLITLPAPHKNFFSLIRALLLTPAPPPSESPGAPVSPHAFIESLHLPRIYKTYLQELSDVCRDYFWVFCHPNNTIWVLGETNENSVERPRAPGGMTGGVEFEAMGYFTTHLKLINAISKSVEALGMVKDHELSAYRFHTDLFLSGLERIILISRKASTTYYPTLHLELARYIAFATRAGFELPYTVARLMGMPPVAHAKNPAAAAAALSGGASKSRSHAGSAPGSPARKSNTAAARQPQPQQGQVQGPGQPQTPVTPTNKRFTMGQVPGSGQPVVPALPSPRRIESMRFEM
ncbi:GTPase-binding protein rid1 [Psilocybe cubensis]|uniref:GTPase-binding protein rid1 n=2 Tax=Psilocybe cubensis TaxID=181762 RepID=A0ACB8H1K2_PSICU|nr:GTPase-binding protein rid1 [Psilocybe cubensis]KAH9481746.1 GTPase-binding protein rid1 [Psilocybe cubensis]